MLRNLAHRILYSIRRAAYERGHRPAPDSILYSPSLALLYAMTDAFPVFEKALKEGRKA